MSDDRPIEVLIIGAGGVFGSRLAQLAVKVPNARLTLAGRRREPLEALSRELNGSDMLALDRDQIIVADVKPFDLVIDCAGPFQGSHTKVIDACLAARVNYVDLADGREFVCSIGRFDEAAKAGGVAVISGASSIPALSHAVLDRLTENWTEVRAIRVGIFPGNRAPRGRSVVEAILSYVGKPVAVFTDGRWRDIPGWALHGRVDCGSAGKRLASVCDTPDQQLLVERYRPTRSAEFVAGLELSVLHLGLWLLSLPVRWRWIRSLKPFAGTMLWIAQRLVPFGTDCGAMIVEAQGCDGHGRSVDSAWTLEATANLGPFVPVLAALALIRRVSEGRGLEVGAYSCAGVVKIEEFEALLDSIGINTTEAQGATEVIPLRAAA